MTEIYPAAHGSKEEVEALISKGREMFGKAFNTKPEIQVDISKIDWKDKEGSPSPPSLDCWAWAFAYDRTGQEGS